MERIKTQQREAGQTIADARPSSATLQGTSQLLGLPRTPSTSSLTQPGERPDSPFWDYETDTCHRKHLSVPDP